MTKPQVYFIIAALFAIAGAYMIACVFLLAGLFFGVISIMAKLPKLPK